MKLKRNTLALIIIGVLLVGVVGYRFATKDVEKPESIEDIQKREGVPVNVMTAEPKTFESWLLFSGNVEAKQQAPLYANIPARVKAVFAKQGDKMYRNKKILSLDPLSSAQTYSALNASRVQYEDAKRLFERMKPLYEAGAISKEEFDQVKSGLKMAQASYTDTTHMVTLRSPIRGILTDLRVNPGDKVDPGQTLAMVADISSIKVTLDVSQSDIVMIREGQKALIGSEKQVSNGGGMVGHVDKISYSADVKTRLFRVEVTLDADKDLRPGTMTYTKIRTYEAENAFAIPIQSLITKGGENFAYVVDSENICRKRPLEVGHVNDESLEVISGLQKGEKVVVWGQNRVKDGQKVKIISAESKNTTESTDSDA